MMTETPMTYLGKKIEADQTEKKYHLVVGNPEPLNKERVTVWLEREGDTVVLFSQREGCAKIYEARFKPDGWVNRNNAPSNFRWSA